MRKLALLIFVFACYVIVNDPAHVFSYAHTQSHSNFSYSASAQSIECDPHAFVNPCADLDTSQIDYADDAPVILPTDNKVITPTILLDGTYVPEESPEGGSPVGWLDNSPTYSDGWTLLVDDSTTPPVISWRAPEGH